MKDNIIQNQKTKYSYIAKKVSTGKKNKFRVIVFLNTSDLQKHRSSIFYSIQKEIEKIYGRVDDIDFIVELKNT